MKILGFPIKLDDGWADDPFSEYGRLPEEEICEVCHVYFDLNGNQYIGIDVSLGLSTTEMISILAPFSPDIKPRKVI
jgi:hypothetical protein